MKNDFEELYNRASSVLNYRQLSDCADAGDVGAAILTENGNIYVGTCIDATCGLGFCAEQAAAAAMITAGENTIQKIIAVDKDGKILPPCGRCREFLSQIGDNNLQAEVMVGEDTIVKLIDLLPYDWRKI
ncbi:cytidine deaminase family protein [Massiliimalia massiliensis]|uniref:cytidine deaminase family protein n=1 Tax=Massiliimalia massiliensis TaxID=1852384 RepID=UPI0009871548|nr:cytidine deaminase [Massiliimalia massiliensis]